jgi:hypothetical protein
MIEHAIAGGPLASERAFLGSYRKGPVKAQLTGPVTLAVAVGDDERALELFLRNAAALEERLRGRPVLCVLDEPSFGARSALHASGLLRQAVEAVASFALTGVHCCGVADWGAIIDAGPHVLSVPVELAGSVPIRALARHVDGGGWVAWGAVPTDRPVMQHDIGVLWPALDAQLILPRLRERSMVTPACGLANLTIEAAGTVFAVTRELGRRIAAN